MKRLARAIIEALETRRLMATVTINGGATSDTFVINRSGTTGRIFVNGALAAAATWDTTVANTISISGSGGDDTLTIDYSFGDPLGSLATFSYDGGSGTDTLAVTGSSSADAVALSSGKIAFNRDNISYTTAENLSLNLGIGTDTLSASGDSSVVEPVAQAFSDAQRCCAAETLKLATGTTIPAAFLTSPSPAVERLI